MEKPSLLNPRGLRDTLEARRFRFQQILAKLTRPVSYQGEYVGMGFRDYADVMKFLETIPEYGRQISTKHLIDKYIRPMAGSYVIGAGFIDEILDHASGTL